MKTRFRFIALVLSAVFALLLSSCSAPSEADTNPMGLSPEELEVAQAEYISGDNVSHNIESWRKTANAANVVENTFSEVYTPEQAEAALETSFTALEVFVEDHPEFTVSHWANAPGVLEAEVAPKLQPLFAPEKWDENFVQYWNMNSSPVLNNYVSSTDSQTWRATNGAPCTASSEPFKTYIQTALLHFYETPQFNATVRVDVPCAEGGTLQAKMLYWFNLEERDGNWILAGDWSQEADTYEGDWIITND